MVSLHTLKVPSTKDKAQDANFTSEFSDLVARYRNDWNIIETEKREFCLC